MQNPTIESLNYPDGYRAHVRWWRPANPVGAVLYLHGIQSHGDWYEASGSRLAERGFSVLMPDRRGSGRNDPPRGHYTSVRQCIDDTSHLLTALLCETGSDSAHVAGVSWGGKQAVLLAQQSPNQVESLTLIGPGLFPKIDLTMPEKFRVGMAMVNNRERLFDIPLNDARCFTANPDRIRYVEQDALKLLRVSASFLLTSRRLDKAIRPFVSSDYRGPIHLFLAGRDKIIDNEQTRRWFRDLPSPDRQITEYPEAEHTIEFEADAEPFFSDLVGWIAERAC